MLGYVSSLGSTTLHQSLPLVTETRLFVCFIMLGTQGDVLC